jgi:hypothetical protein
MRNFLWMSWGNSVSRLCQRDRKTLGLYSKAESPFMEPVHKPSVLALFVTKFYNLFSPAILTLFYSVIIRLIHTFHSTYKYNNKLFISYHSYLIGAV